MDSSVFIHEDLRQQIIADPPIATDNISVSKDGCIAMLSGRTLHVYQPQFEYMAFYRVSWLEALDPIKGSTSNDLSYREPMDWLSLPRSSVVGASAELSLLSHAWMPSFNGLGNWSVVLFSEGTALILKSSPFTAVRRYELSQPAYAVRLHGLDLLLDLTKTSAVSPAYHMVLGHVDTLTTILCMAVGCDEHLKVEVYRVVTSAAPVPAVTKLTTFQVEHKDQATDKVKHMLVSRVANGPGHVLYAVTAAGRVLQLPVPAAATKRTAATYDIQLDRHIVPEHMTLVDGRAVLVSNAGMLMLDQLVTCRTPSGRTQAAGTARSRISSTCSWSDQDHLTLLSSTLDGTVTSDQVVLQANQLIFVHDPVSVEVAITGSAEALGLAVDPLSLLAICSLRMQPSLEWTREVQQNRSLMSARTAFRTFVPSLPQEWMADHVLLSSTILQVVERRYACPDSSLALLVLVLLQGIDAIEHLHSELPMKPIPQELLDYDHGCYEERELVKRTGDSDEEGDEDGDAEPDDEDAEKVIFDYSDSDEDMGVRPKAPKPKSRKAVTPSPKRIKAPQEKPGMEGKYGLTKIYDAIKCYLPPDPVAMAAIAMDYLLDGCSAAAGQLTGVMSASDKASMLLGMPNDTKSLLKHMLLWQVWHFSTRAIRQVRRPAAVNEIHDRLVVDVRQQIIFAQCFLAADRLLKAVEAKTLDAKRIPPHEQRTLQYIHEILCKSLERSPHLQPHAQRIAQFKGLLPAGAQGHEQCAVCAEDLPFDPLSPEASYCPTCALSYERCCFSYQLITTAPSSELYRCPVCVSAASHCWVTAARGLYQLMYTQHSLLCPFCAVLCTRLN